MSITSSNYVSKLTEYLSNPKTLAVNRMRTCAFFSQLAWFYNHTADKLATRWIERVMYYYHPLFHSYITHDIIFYFSTDETVKARSLVLSAISPYFRHLIKQHQKNTSGYIIPIKIEDVKPHIIDKLVKTIESSTPSYREMQKIRAIHLGARLSDPPAAIHVTIRKQKKHTPSPLKQVAFTED